MQFCTHCGSALDSGSRFCGGCGRPSLWNAQTPIANAGGFHRGRRVWLVILVVLATLSVPIITGIVKDRQEADAKKRARREAKKVKSELWCTVADPEAVHVAWNMIREMYSARAIIDPVEESKNDSVIPNSSAFHFSYKIPGVDGLSTFEAKGAVQVHLADANGRCEVLGRIVEEP